MRKQIELAIARLERVNAQLKKLFTTAGGEMSGEQINEVLDEILANEKVVEKLEKGLN